MKWSPLYYWYIANTAKTPNNQSIKLNEMDGIFYGSFFLSVNMTDWAMNISYQIRRTML